VLCSTQARAPSIGRISDMRSEKRQRSLHLNCYGHALQNLYFVLPSCDDLRAYLSGKVSGYEMDNQVPFSVTTRHPGLWVRVDSSSGLKKPECDAGQSPPFSAKVTNTWALSLTAYFVFIA
jgi:hypothetical protein